MNFKFKSAAAAVLAAAFAVSYAHASGPAAPAKEHRATRRTKDSSIEQQIQALRNEMQSQIDELKQELAGKNAQLQQARQAAAQAKAAAQKANAATTSQQQAVDENTTTVKTLQSSVNEMKASSSSLSNTVKVVQKQQKQMVKKSQLSDLALGKIKLGVTFYGDFAHYTDTGFGPQFLTQLNQPGPGNGGFNSFDITRTYLNFLYTPTGAVTLRVTPNIFRAVDGSSTPIANGKNAVMGGSTNGNLTFRLKYAYVQFNHPFKGSKAFGKDVIRLGQTMNPLVDWEEGLFQYRFVALTPWNYLSLSSTYVGAEMNGPIEHKGKEYLDYQFGVFNDTSFHHIEQSDTKQFMNRITWYPVGTTADRTGFALTAFNAFGFNNKTPDTKSTSQDTFAAIASYQTHDKGYEIVGEYDYGHNAFSAGNLFSGAGPSPTGSYATWDSMENALLAGGDTKQQGFDFFGHARLGHSKYKLFGLFENFQPNTNISGTNPIDFNRTVGGISYQYNHNLIFALDDQNLTYYHSQFTMTPAQISTFSPSLADQNPNGIPDAVPNGSNAIFLNMQYSY